jgi:hypothetical protein
MSKKYQKILNLSFVPKKQYDEKEYGPQYFTMEMKDYSMKGEDYCLFDSYAIYKMVFQRGKVRWTEFRRYSEFDAFHTYLVETYQYQAQESFPDLPPKSFFKRTAENFLESRRILLGKYVNILLSLATKYGFVMDHNVLDFFSIDPHIEVSN